MAYPPAGLALDPQTLAQLAAAAFKPPQPMQMAPLNLNAQVPGLNMGPQEQKAPSNGIGAAAAGLGLGIPYLADALGGKGTGADMNGYSGNGSMVDVGGGKMLPNPNGMQFGPGGVPLGTAAASPSFWSNFNPFNWGR